ncbi:MAG TPA: alpha/beta hydrolase, partial [Candidatus Dojkabacteria bacterium]|nr:alpha/beta hydrolase [Candidatus Dojkabacteria bacterium]
GMELNSYFLKEKHIDMNMIRKNTKNISIIFGNDDPYVPQNELKYLSEKLNVEEMIIEKGGHLNTETGYTKFPLLLEECLKIVED